MSAGESFDVSRYARSAPARLLLFLLLATWLASSQALAQSSFALLKWKHPNPSEVVKFRVFFSSDPKAPENARAVDVGLPGKDGVFSWPVPVEQGSSVWVAVKAVGEQGAESDFSEWRRFDWDASQTRLSPPGRPQLVE